MLIKLLVRLKIITTEIKDMYLKVFSPWLFFLDILTDLNVSSTCI